MDGSVGIPVEDEMESDSPFDDDEAPAPVRSRKNK
jgi:hypothetical protein